MKILTVVVVILGCVALSQQQDNREAFIQKLHENFQTCIKESGVNPELPRKAVKEGDFADDKNLKCFFKCMFEKMGYMDSSGKLNFGNMDTDNIPPNMDKAKVVEVANKCQSTKGSDACDTAFQVAKCFRAGVGSLIHEGSN